MKKRPAPSRAASLTPDVPPSLSQSNFPRSGSPSGFGNFLSRPAKWFQRSNSNPKSVQDANTAVPQVRRQIISQPTDVRPLLQVAKSLSTSQSYQDLLHPSVDVLGQPASRFQNPALSSPPSPPPSSGLLEYSRKSRSVDDLSQYVSVEDPGMTNRVKAYQNLSHPGHSTQGRPIPASSGGVERKFTFPTILEAPAVEEPEELPPPPIRDVRPRAQSHGAKLSVISRSAYIPSLPSISVRKPDAMASDAAPTPASPNGSVLIPPLPSNTGTPTLSPPGARSSQIIHLSGFLAQHSSQHASLSKGWAPRKVVLKGTKLFFFKPPKDRVSDIKALFPLGNVAEPQPSINGDTGSGVASTASNPRKRVYWGRDKHPELCLSADGNIYSGTADALLHECVFRTSFSNVGGDVREAFLRAVFFCLPHQALMGRTSFEAELNRRISHFVDGASEEEDGILEAREHSRILLDLYESIWGGFEDKVAFKTWHPLIAQSATTDKRPGTPIPSPADFPLPASPAPGPRSPGHLAANESSMAHNLPRMAAKARSQARLWNALEKEGFSVEIFSRLDHEKVAYSLRVWGNAKLQELQRTKVSMGGFFERTSDRSLGRALDIFAGSDVVPHWLTYTVLHHLLGERSSTGEGDVEGQARTLTHLSRTHTRADLLGRWVAVGESARLSGDFCTWGAIKNAVCCKAVARLEKVWKRVSHRERKCVEDWVRRRSPTEGEEGNRVPWLGDGIEAILQLLKSIPSDEIEKGYLVASLLKVQHRASSLFTEFDNQMQICSRGVNDNLEGEAAALARLWDNLSSRPPENSWAIDQFLELSYAAEPRQKLRFNPHFWAPPHTTSIHPCLPLLFPEPLPCATFLDKSSILPTAKQDNVERNRVLQPEEVLSLLPENHFRSVMGIMAHDQSSDPSLQSEDSHSLAHSNDHDVGNTFISAHGGELILKILPSSSAMNPQSLNSRLLAAPTFNNQSLSGNEGSSLKRKPSLAPSFRTPTGSPGMNRQPSTRGGRRSSLPSLSRASSLAVPERKIESPLRATVSAGTLDRLVDTLVEGLKVSVTSTDDTGLSSGRSRSLVVDLADFSKSWWHTFRSFVTPMVFFELMLKRYLRYSSRDINVGSSIADESKPFKSRQLEVLNVLKDWMEVGGGPSDVLDEPQLFHSINNFTIKLIEEADRDNNDEGELNDARRHLASIFAEQSQRPRLSEESTNLTQSSDVFGTSPPSIDDLRPDELVANLDSIASAIMAAVTSDDLLVTYDILEVQTADRLGWYPPKDPSMASDEVLISNMYSLIQLVQPSSLSAGLTSQDTLLKAFPPSIRMVLRCHAVIRKWLTSKLMETGITPSVREERMQTVLRAVEYCRLGVKRTEDGCDDLDSFTHMTQQRKFVESALCAAILSPESRLFGRAWQNAASARGRNIDSLHLLLSQGFMSAQAHLRRLTLDIGWILERLVELGSLPDIMTGEHTLINFDKRRYISTMASYIPDTIGRNGGTDRVGIDRMNNMLKEAIASERGYRLVKEDAQRESVQLAPSYIGRRNIRPFQSLITAQVEKVRRDRQARERLSKEKRQEQQRNDRFESEMNRAMQPSKRPSLNLSKHERGKRSMSALFRVVRPISTAFISDRANVQADIKRRRFSTLDFQPIGKPSLVLSLAGATSSIFHSDERPYTFDLTTEDGGKWLFQATSHMELVRWTDAIIGASKKRLTYNGNDQPQLSDIVGDMSRTREHVPYDAVFGVSLDSLVSRESSTPVDGEGVPVILQQLINEVEYRGLTEVGIYRISGGVGAINTLKRLYDEGFTPDLRNDERFVDIHCICGTVKLFLRQLPEPLIPFSVYSDAIDSSRLTDYNQRSLRIRELVHSLPPVHFSTLRRLIEHLDRVTDYEESNQMTAESLAICFSPSLLQPPPSPASFALGIGNMGPAMVFTKGLILQFHRIFDDSDAENELVDVDQAYKEATTIHGDPAKNEDDHSSLPEVSDSGDQRYQLL